MTRPWQSVRTDEMAYEKDEAIPFYLHPQHCAIHRVSWWTDEDPTLKEMVGRSPMCPCCNGEFSMADLVLLESFRRKKP